MVAFCCLLFSSATFAASTNELNLVNSGVGYAALIIFSIAYILVMLEEYLKMRKSKPVLLAAGLIWILIGYTFAQHNQPEIAKSALEHNLLEYAELLLFLLVAMTYINAMEERKLFDALQAWMVGKGF
ncbi:sodium:proton antiporter NhaD, partial [Vibrio parahaemolyticus]|nr:sodium:proton antiporter NhaD [Vibrio parahaemolyticus]